MLKTIGIFTNILLILIIFLRISEENAGLASFTTKSDFLGSPRSARRFLNILTGVLILNYLGIGFLLNLLKN
jgi:preprotein translocase subunit SecG